LIVNEEAVPAKAISFLDAFSGQTTLAATKVHWGFQGRAIFCRPDGAFVVAAGAEFELFDRDGRGSPGRFALDPTSRGSVSDSDTGAWSPDGRVLAIWAQGGSLSLFDPGESTMTTVTPNGSIATAYAWAKEHQLVVATHSIDTTDFAIVSIDGLEPKGRTPIGHPAAAVTGMTALPNDLLATIDASSKVSIRSLSDDDPSWNGMHMGARSLHLSGDTLLSSSPSEVRLWNVPPLSANWFFRSDERHRYLRCAAGDPGFRWLAAGFKTKQGVGVYMRGVDGKEEDRSLPAGSQVKSCDTLAFSSDGEWLAVVGQGGASLFNTTTQARTDFSLPDDQEIWHVYVGSGAMLFANGPTRRVLEISSSGPRLVDIGLLPKAATKGDGAGGCLGSFAEVEQLRKLIDGWRPLSPETPADTMLLGCLGSGWVERLILRNGAITDIEFIPTNLNRLRGLHQVAPLAPERLRAIVERRMGRVASK
jgi:hypothetical protein